jgi:hypothetical protein
LFLGSLFQRLNGKSFESFACKNPKLLHHYRFHSFDELKAAILGHYLSKRFTILLPLAYKSPKLVPIKHEIYFKQAVAVDLEKRVSLR